MDLQCHLATHNKLFKCSMCEESFLVEYLLDKHLQLVHSEAGSSSETGNIHYDVTSSNGTHAKVSALKLRPCNELRVNYHRM
ncbi:hypothetical protein DPMN_177287 [Dreissena polymorpha]|uniref:C2H2-type domain-containing protein n=1 Tax=Dreissena polymorpha TaxID=45954 RepID=A0A9D4ED03_DREPO|nr:hypothetical protein DPMN_177287 [Dreissena polymorpha]